MNKFDEWNNIKKKLDNNRHLPTFNEREIWWCSIGMNIGFEVYGKDSKFWRPVLILDKHNRHTFFGLPMGSTLKKGRHFYRLDINDRKGSILLSQGRTLSSKRLSNIITKISEKKFEAIKKVYKDSF